MMQNIAYRLAGYRITEDGHGDLWWETHIGLGSLKSGKCFINGDILFIAPSDFTGPGFLKGEFLDHLNKLPKWEKTKYYCASYKIYESKPGSRKPIFERRDGRLKNEVNIQDKGSTQRVVAKLSLNSVKVDAAAHVSYKLGRYEITEMNNGQLFWKSSGGLGRLKKGRCHIQGSILFLEPGETEQSDLMKREFMQQLNRLPDWEKTKYICAGYAIYYSSTGAMCRRLGEDKDVNRTGTQNVVVGKNTFGVGKDIRPTIVNKIIAKDELTTFLKFCKILVMLILRLFFECFQMIYKVIRVFTGKWTRFRG